MPVNRVVAFAGPHISIAAGAFATWLLLKVHIIGALGFGHDQVASAIAYVATFGITSGLTWAGHQKWLTGYQQWEARDTLPVYVPPLAPDNPATIPADVAATQPPAPVKGKP